MYTRLLFTVLLQFTVYMITVTVLLLSLYHPSVLRDMILITLIEINNNINGQLTVGLEKLMEETTSVFWVDLGYRCAAEMRVPLQGSWG